MNPKMRLRSLKLFVRTEFGVAERKLDFREGLNIIRADNTSGKSTALQAIVYALGLEGMLSPSRRIPLAHAMTASIEIDGELRSVVESYVALEIENARGDIITIMRSVVDRVRDRNLVTVAYGPELTVAPKNRREDYFVRLSGGAQNVLGFHRYLADFLELKLPRVTRMDGSEGPLYLETLFPYFYVEQKHGWAGVQARIPTYLGIRDVGKRSAEYILGLESLDRILQRQRVRSSLSELEADWQGAVSKLSEAARVSRVVLQNLPKRISHVTPQEGIVPRVVLNGEWKDLAQAITILRAELAQLEASPVPTAGSSAREVESNLQQTEHSLRQALAVSASIAEEREELERQNQQTQLRLEALQEDLQKHKDTQVLERLGSQHAHALLAEHVCPTCHQHLEDGADISTHAMTSAESIKFIEQQISTFKNVHDDHQRVIAAMLAREQSLATEIHDYRSEIRAARDTLKAPNSSPSVAAIAQRLRLEGRIEELDELKETLEVSRREVEHLRERWVKQRGFLKSLETDDLSQADRGRIERLQHSVRTQLASYRFQSLNPSEIEIDTTTYRPVHEGFDLGFDLSASDMIRLIWAYLFGLLEVGQETGGRHLGILVFDEPRQQDAARDSYAALLAYASRAGEEGAQVLFATSEPEDSLKEMLADNPAYLLLLAPGEKLLKHV
ncbi:AAA domain-containing protein [Brevibacterium sanguinis]|uniref:Nuclease SbcCD subunit C n=2 Tax=Brevibacterium TaxID=1696 RepID=A0A366ILB9_9MICO|nr:MULTISPECIES: AAA family ATPase [Brevibacterium]RBP65428.1 AAA domain-containing protein [Brevibacterium sanguinis]RBP72062.1 AAA domain-containing protein [Brevibacterium celere]